VQLSDTERRAQSATRSKTPLVSHADPSASPLACADHERCSAGFKACACHVDTRRAVLLLNLGTPDSPAVGDVRRYLAEFLADPWVIRLPRAMRWFNPVLSRIIALARGRKSARAYQSIWTSEGSPLAVITRRQAEGLGARLPRGWRVFHAMRYGNPSLLSVLESIADAGVTDLVVVPMYPQWSGPTTGTALEAFYAAMGRLRDVRRGLRLNVSVRAEWYDDAGYVDATARQVHRAAVANGLTPENSTLLISAHSLPQSYVVAGDPYEGHIRRTAELVRERLGWPLERMRIGFQSKLGPVPWLSPSTGEVLAELAAEGERNVLCLPLSFTADCLETLEEIGIEYAEEFARASGGGRLVRIAANNDDAGFLDALVGLVRRGAHRIAPGTRPTPLFAPEANEPDLSALIERLVVVSAATGAHVVAPPALARPPLSDEALRAVKRPQLEAAECVARIAAGTAVDEAWLYNTCQRYELYALAGKGADLETLGATLAESIAGEAASGLSIWTGAAAYWHLLRTACGLNSRLPGDADVLEQLHAALRLAEGSGAAGRGANAVIAATADAIAGLRQGTAFGKYQTDYCRAALAPLLGELHLERARVALLGGSTTTLSLVGLLARDCAVPGERVTVVYRSATQRRLAKVLKKLAQGARRLVVDEYDGSEVLATVAEVDVLFLGVDRQQPVLRRGHIEGLRDFDARPLVVIDFNVNGSTEGLGDIPGVRVVGADQLDRHVEGYSTELSRDDGFVAALAIAELRLQREAYGAQREPVSALPRTPANESSPRAAAPAARDNEEVLR